MEPKTIVITGSTRGIGLGLAREFLDRGHRVVINGRSEEGVARTLRVLQQTGPDVLGVQGDVSVEETHQRLVEQSVSVFGSIDIWINNAGIPQPYMLFTDSNSTDIRALVDVNITGLLLGTYTAARHMTRQGYGKIFNMEGFGSDGRTMKKLVLYGTSKRAVSYFTKAFARELRDTQVQAGVLSPGMVKTEFIDESMKHGSTEEILRFRKVYDVLAEDVEVVTKFLVNGILKSSGNYDRIVFLSRSRAFFRMLKMIYK